LQLQVKPLIAELQWVNRFIEKKTTIPILATVLFEVKGKRLTLTATDLEIAGVTSVEGRSKADWAVAAPVAKLIQYLGKVDEDEVTLATTDDNWLTVSHGAAATRIVGMGKDSYPELPAVPDPQVTLRNLPLTIERTSFAISKEASRFTLNGALLVVDADGTARMVATDGHRLSLAPVQAKDNTEKIRALLPKKALIEAARMEEDCAFSVDEQHAFLTWGQRRIIARKLTGNFPDYARVMSEEFPSHVMVPVKSTRKVLDRVALYADERSRAVQFNIGDGKLTIFAKSVEQGEAEGTVAVQPGEGDGPLTIGLNADYVNDFLSRTDLQFAAYCWQDKKSGSQFMTGDGWRYVVMPMRID
jgi:DNA polymerase-3 subunit beta